MEKLIKSHEKLGITSFIPEFEVLINKLRKEMDNPVGNPLKYTRAMEQLPDYIIPSSIMVNKDRIEIGKTNDIPEEKRPQLLAQIKSTLLQFSPWRKGPFELFGIHIDTEWQSNIKWNRLINEISNLKNRRILDIGSSNGYYMFRMSAHAPWMVLGVEPQHTFYYQYLALQKYLNLDNLFCLPITFDELPVMKNYFDTVFCMGVLYHRPSPVEMLKRIHSIMKKGGELVLENLIIEKSNNLMGANSDFSLGNNSLPLCLFPENRYAKMRNVFFIPNIKAMESWLERTGFTDIRCVDISKTDMDEQRKTEWIETESLQDFLDPENPSKTVEGYPAPVRAIFIARSH
ncbi:tRNA (mo5U34)-methyltransferase [Desulfamplus magnetovallimortis]|uniref:tRNA (Mo5U34)-methyltransferase n=1 Tax=Desulfamplus magnetovallimortis TaxID=1246637 RepID=A0A1W1HEV3_9BACT|nr:tRNA 5-methoxyuridine(34)/uridine 5-oxyacetic acid(34) synthase CmoB [Desulfamplus magnetovallimortis]SLM31024.1 tRNA (mo5U34)-methyltransferase [Desulfamplus magnetovallimortis]